MWPRGMGGIKLMVFLLIQQLPQVWPQGSPIGSPQLTLSWWLCTKTKKSLVGIENARDELTEKLCLDDDVSKQLKILSIVGFGGLGKITLAKAIYDKVRYFDQVSLYGTCVGVSVI